MKSIIVIPTNRGQNITEWFRQWKKQFAGHAIIMLEDGPIKTFRTPADLDIYHYSWNEIDAELGEYAWIIPRRAAAIRSFGFYKAWQMEPDMVVTIDDDCYPDDSDFLERHWTALNTRKPIGWFQHFPGIRVRGLPYNLETAQTVINMGLWSNIPDFDAQTQLANPYYRSKRSDFNIHAPFGYFLPLSSMNIAFKPEIIPAYYFLLMGEEYGHYRFDDIWAGVFIKKICDHLGFAISGGSPFVRHERASDPLVNLQKEKGSLEINEQLWRIVAAMKLEGTTFAASYISLARQLPEYTPYWTKLKKAMMLWASLFDTHV